MTNIDFQVIVLSEKHFLHWDSFVDESPQGDVFCYSWWLNAITKGDFKILAIFEDEEIVAGIPLAYINGKVNEPPLTRTLGPLFKNLAHLTEHKQTTKKRQWLTALIGNIPIGEVEQFCTSHTFTDWLPFRWRGFRQTTRYTYLINYKNKDEAKLWSDLSRGVKETIAKSRKAELFIKHTEDLLSFYHLIELTYKRQDLKFRFSYDDFKRLDDEVVEHQKRIIITVFDEQKHEHAAIYLVFSDKSAYALLSAGNPDLRHLGGQTLVMWEAIKYFHDKVEYFNFGGSDIERIENHLKGFGGVLTPYFHIFTEKTIVKEIKQIEKIEIVKEVYVLPPPTADDWRYHVNLIFQHTWVLIKKALYKIHIRFKEPVKMSVVTACFNHGKYIHEMLESVFKQSFQNFEIIIVNDGSTDDTSVILNKIKHQKVKIFHTENFGPAHARNLAIENASGELIINLDADDKIAPDFLRRCVEIMTAKPDNGIVYSDVELFGYKEGPFILNDYSFENMLRANCIVANACFRKSDWKKTGGYSSDMIHGYEDFDFWLSILELGREVSQIKEPLVFYRTYENQEESRSGRRKQNPMQMEEVIVQAFNRHKSLYEKRPDIFNEFSEKEIQFNLKKNKHLNDPEYPVFSIVTPTNRRPQLLKRAIDSVRNQSFSNWEQIIVDDANDQETADIVAGLNDPRIKYLIHNTPKGAAGAYNTGMKMARGQFINFLDDDDEYLPGILGKILEAFTKGSKIPDFVWTGITRVLDMENVEKTIRTQAWPADFNNIEEGLMVSTAIGNGFGLSVKKSCIDVIGFYDETLKVGEDTDFMIRLSKKFTFRTVPEVLVKIHHHENNQLTHDKYIKVKWDSYGRIIKRHFDFLSMHWDTMYMHNSVYINLCYRLNERKSGRKAMWSLIKKFPTRRIAWLDLLCYEISGKTYNSSELKNQVLKLKRVVNQKSAFKKDFIDGNAKLIITRVWTIMTLLFKTISKVIFSTIKNANKRKLNILFYTHNFNHEGAPNVLYDLVFALQKKRKYNICVVSPINGLARQSLNQHGIKTVVLTDCNQNHYEIDFEDKESFHRFKRKIVEVVTNNDIDVAFVNVLHNYHVINILSDLKIPSVWMIHESFDEMEQFHLAQNCTINYTKAFEQAKTVVFCTQYSQQYYEAYHLKNNFRIIHNALNQSFRNLKPNDTLKNKARNKLGIQPDELVILNVGIIVEHKNQEIIIKAARSLTGKKLKYFLVGGRKPLPYLEKMVRLVSEFKLEKEITVVSETSDIDSFYRAADIFVFTSVNDTYPLAILEAMAYGLPIITTPINGVKEQVKFGYNAIKADYTCPDKLAGQINYLAENKKIRMAMGKNSRKVFKKLDSFKDVINTHELVILDAYDKTLKDVEKSVL